jgi:hypothetical protein
MMLMEVLLTFWRNCRHLEDQRFKPSMQATSLLVFTNYLSVMKMKVVRFARMPVNFYRIMHHHIPEDQVLFIDQDRVQLQALVTTVMNLHMS